MRKLITVGLVSFAGTVFAIAGMSQPRRPPRRPPAAAQAETPPSPRIAQELGRITWGMTHEQVLEYFRAGIRAAYQPRMKNLGQIEQFRLQDQRDQEIRHVEQSYIVFDGTTEHRRWDTSFVGEEYAHNNNESMIVYEDSRGNREFMFFINDHLWKRIQARNTNGRTIDLSSFSTQLEGVFGPGRRVMEGTRLRTIEWHDEHTRLHVIDGTMFYNVFCLAYEDLATVAQLPTLRRNVPVKAQRVARPTDTVQAEAGNVTGDPSPDIVDRITGKMRRVQASDAGAAASASNPGRRPAVNTAANPGTNSNSPPTSSLPDDPLAGLGL